MSSLLQLVFIHEPIDALMYKFLLNMKIIRN